MRFRKHFDHCINNICDCRYTTIDIERSKSENIVSIGIFSVKLGNEIFFGIVADMRIADPFLIDCVLEYRLSSKKLARYLQFILMWIPGYREITGNCKADVLGGVGANLNIYDSQQLDISAPMNCGPL